MKLIRKIFSKEKDYTESNIRVRNMLSRSKSSSFKGYSKLDVDRDFGGHHTYANKLGGTLIFGPKDENSGKLVAFVASNKSPKGGLVTLGSYTEIPEEELTSSAEKYFYKIKKYSDVESKNEKLDKELKNLKKIRNTTLGGMILSIGGFELGKNNDNKLITGYSNEATKYGDDLVTKRLERIAKNKGIILNKIPDASQSSYIEVIGTGKSNVKKLINYAPSSPSTLGHELGHSSNWEKKIPRKIYTDSVKLKKHASKIAAVGGFRAGLRRAEGKKEGIAKHSGLIAGITANAPRLIDEGTASLKSLDMLKRLGANKSQLKAGKKNLTAAFGTYAGNALVDVGKSVLAGEIGKGAGYATSKAIQTIKKKKDNKKK